MKTSLVAPGSVLKREIDFLGITENELADRMGQPASAVCQIIAGQTAVTPEIALQLETIIGTNPHLWTNLEARYRLAIARTAELAELESEIPLLDDFQMAKLEERGWIPQAKSQTERVRLLRVFLGVASLNAYKRVNAPAYRLPRPVPLVERNARRLVEKRRIGRPRIPNRGLRSRQIRARSSTHKNTHQFTA